MHIWFVCKNISNFLNIKIKCQETFIKFWNGRGTLVHSKGRNSEKRVKLSYTFKFFPVESVGDGEIATGRERPTFCGLRLKKTAIFWRYRGFNIFCSPIILPSTFAKQYRYYVNIKLIIF